MTRAVRVWAALSESERAAVWRLAWADDLGSVLDALDADLAEHQAHARTAHALGAKPFQAFLIHERDAGPRLPAQACDDCGEACTRARIPFYDFAGRVTLLLGEGCWRDRMLRRRRGEDVPGDQLQAFPAPMPTRKD